ncbi:MAG: AAA family ATPase [Actinobacteria bacterium]|nr:AAA family ATPase [Actinomycetota bacterium]
MRVYPHIAILGTVEVAGAGRSVALPGSNLPVLLSLLALTPGRPVSNEQLIDALWPRADPDRGRRSLTSLVHQLNLALGSQFGVAKPVVSVKSVGRVLTIDPSRIDVVQFELRFASAERHRAQGHLTAAADAYAAALRLWRGEPFGGVDLACLIEPSTRLRALRDRADAALVDVSLRLGRGSAFVPRLIQRALDDPTDEDAASAAARALYQAGRSGEALRVLRACIDERRLGQLSIGAEIRRLEVAVLEHDIEVAAEAASRELPAAAKVGSGLIGREHERAVLHDWLDDGRRERTMLITGDAGIGKTTLVDDWLASLPSGHRAVLGRAVAGGDPLAPMRGLIDRVAASETTDALFEQVVQRVTDPNERIHVLVVDDAHWIAPAAVGLLRHLVFHPDVQGLRVVLVARTPEASANEALAQLTSDLGRAGRSLHLVLRPFERTEIDEMIIRLRGDVVAGELDADALLKLAGGNPLFTAEVLRAPRGASQLDVPPAVIATYGRFLGHLSPASRRILRAAAELGPTGEPRQVAARAGVDELDVIDALDEVAGGRLVHIEREGGAYRFVTELARRVTRTAVDASG